MRTKTLLILFFTLSAVNCFGQKEWSNWYFNGNNLLTFRNNNLPQIQTNFITPAPTYWWSYRYNSYNGTAYSDPNTGQMKFLLAGRLAYDKNYDLIEKSMDLRGCPGDKYAFHIIPFSNNPNKFYIIQFQSVVADLYAAQSSLQVRCPNAIGLGYSILDLSLNNGLGDFTSINKVLQPFMPEGSITLVRHANGKDTWVIVHGWENKQFYAYLFSDKGISEPVITSIGPFIGKASSTSGGVLTASHDGHTIASQIGGYNSLELYDFDNSKGILTNYRNLVIPYAANRMIFSPDNSKLYILGAYLAPGVFQFDFNATDIQSSLTKIADDPHTSFYDMQLGTDGKIYIGGLQVYDAVTYNYTYYLPVINCPNLPKYACNYNAKGLSVPYGYGQFPNFINDYITQPKAPRITEFSLGNDTSLCFGIHKLSAPEGWQNYRWNTGATTREITISTPGLYYVLAGEEGFSCPSAFGSIKIKNAAKPLNLGKDTVLCPGHSYTLQAPSDFSNLLWNDGTTLHSKVIAKSATYTLKAEDENGCTNWDTVTVGFKFDPRAYFGNDTVLCTSQSLTLQLEPRANPFGQPGIYLWQNGSTTDSFKVMEPGTYWGQVTYQGCTISDTIHVNYVNAETVNLGADTTLCEGDSLPLKINLPHADYLWSTGATTPAITVRRNGTYWVRVNNGICSVLDTIQVSFRPKPALFVGNDTLLCDKQPLTLKANVPGAICLWQDGSTQNSFDVKEAGLYWVKVSLNGCSSDSILVRYKALPYLDLGKDTGLCVQQTIFLNAAHPSIQSYLWQDGSTLPTFLVNGQGTYQVRVKGINGCINKDTITISTHSLPIFTLGNDTTLCEQQQLPVNISLPNAFYKWNTGNQTNNFTISGAGLYWLTVTQNGCSKTDSIAVHYKPLPSVYLGNDTTVCEGFSKTLDVTNTGATYLWQDGSTRPTYQITKPGLYAVRVTLDGCIKNDNIQVFYKYKPRFTLGSDTTLCTGQQLILNPRVSNAFFLWQDGSTTPSFTVRDAGLYKLTVTNECGSSYDEILIVKGSCKLFMPNAFTPNHDGLNDIFRVKDPGFIKTFKMIIYNRWGEIVFKTEDASSGWDGQYKGMDQPMGNYIWQITLTTKESDVESRKGNVLLVR